MRDRPSSPVTRRHAVSAFALGCGLATGCAEPLPQSPAVDVLTYIGVEAEVTAARLPAPLVVDGRRRSEVAPGDTVRLRATFADVGRLYPPQASASGLEVEWYLCSESSCGGAGDDPPPCPAPLR
ncbi:MAG: hypothetical protein KC468_13265, partial [Myxococcales bacterium]|nr:hypothetical protein [Myxococcales bacterium]